MVRNNIDNKNCCSTAADEDRHSNESDAGFYFADDEVAAFPTSQQPPTAEQTDKWTTDACLVVVANWVELLSMLSQISTSNLSFGDTATHLDGCDPDDQMDSILQSLRRN